MNNLFVSYEIAKRLKEKGFDEYCIGRYGNNSKKIFTDKKFKNSDDLYSNIPNDWCNDFTASPIYQQVVDWFREKHNIHIFLNPLKNGEKIYYQGNIFDKYFIRNKLDLRITDYNETLIDTISEALKLI